MNRKYAITFIFITVVIDSMGIGLIMPVMPTLLIEVGGQDLAQAAVWGGTLAAVFAFMQFLAGPVMGNLSDRFGRKPVLIGSLAVLCVDYIVMGFANSLWLLFAARMIGGISSSAHSTATAFMADVSKPEEKAQNFGLIGAAFGIGFVLGPAFGGLLAEFGSRAPFFAAGFLAFANMLFGVFVLPETVTDRTRRPFDIRRANPLGSFRHIGKLPELPRLLFVFFVYNLGFYVYPSVWSYYTQEAFEWTPQEIGVSLAAFGIGIAIAQGWVIRIMVPRLGEHACVILSFMVNMFSFVCFGFITESYLVFLLIPLTCIGALASPAMNGIMSRAVGDDEQGELQGIITSVVSVGTILSPLITTQIFGYFTSGSGPVYLPGAPFLLSAGLVLLALLVFMGRRRLSAPG